MALRRMISNTLGGSKKIAKLLKTAGKSADFCQVVYMIGIPWADDFGQLTADPWEWKYNFFRVSPKSENDFKKALTVLVDVGLFEVSACNKAIRYTNFFKFQTLKKDRPAKNDFPGFQWIPEDSRHEGSKKFPYIEVKLSKKEVEVEVEVEVETKYTQEYEKCRKSYPLPQNDNKGEGAEKYQATLKKGATVDQLLVAALNYALTRKQEDRKYNKHMKTFFGHNEHWKDYLEITVDDLSLTKGQRQSLNNWQAGEEAERMLNEQAD